MHIEEEHQTQHWIDDQAQQGERQPCMGTTSADFTFVEEHKLHSR